MSLDLAFDDGQQAIADAIARFCADHFDDDAVRASIGTLPRSAWTSLAELGVFGLLTPDGGGGALETVAAMESLGRAVFPGPLAATFLASFVLEDPERTAVADGSWIACVGVPPLLPWAPASDGVLEIDGERLFRARIVGELERIDTLGGEPWGRARLERQQELSRGPAGLVLYRILLAAQLAAMGQRLVEDASRHAAVRKQFGRPIGDFQAVAHPLADCAMRTSGAATLARAAACRFDAGDDREARRLAAAAHLSATQAGLDAAYVCHQVFGAIGITLEGPVFLLSRRIRQLASGIPSRDASRALLLATEVAA